MFRALLVAASIFAAACSIAPVVTDPTDGGFGSRYDDCRRAARNYCADFVQPAPDDMKKCVAEATFNCVSGNR